MTRREGFLCGLVGMCAAVVLVPRAAAQYGPAYFYYQGIPYGSQATISPAAAVLHSGYYSFQIDNRPDVPFDLAYEAGLANVLANLANPFAAIGDYGWGRFFTTEVLPNPSKEGAQWVPNYFGHILGEGLVYRVTFEWYRYHGVANARLLAILSTLTGAMLNEVVENGTYDGPNVDPIADFYLFNPLGILVFSSESAARFFARDLGLAYWPQQAALDPVSGALHNTGYRTVFRVHPFRWRLGLFASYGNQGLAGLSYRLSWRDRLTVGAGIAARELLEVDTGDPGRQLTADVGPAFGVFFDRNNSLLASLIATPEKLDKIVLNVYPGILGPRGFRPGFTVGWHEADGLKLAVHLAGWPVGLAAHTGTGRPTPP